MGISLLTFQKNYDHSFDDPYVELLASFCLKSLTDFNEYSSYSKRSTKLPRGLLKFAQSRGLLERVIYSQNQKTMIFITAFQFFTPYFANSIFDFVSQIHKFGRVFPNHIKINKQACLAQ